MRLCSQAPSPQRNLASALAAEEATGILTSPGSLVRARNAVYPSPMSGGGFPGNGPVVDPAWAYVLVHLSSQSAYNSGIEIVSERPAQDKVGNESRHRFEHTDTQSRLTPSIPTRTGQRVPIQECCEGKALGVYSYAITQGAERNR